MSRSKKQEEQLALSLPAEINQKHPFEEGQVIVHDRSSSKGRVLDVEGKFVRVGWNLGGVHRYLALELLEMGYRPQSQPALKLPKTRKVYYLYVERTHFREYWNGRELNSDRTIARTYRTLGLARNARYNLRNNKLLKELLEKGLVLIEEREIPIN